MFQVLDEIGVDIASQVPVFEIDSLPDFAFIIVFSFSHFKLIAL